MIIREGRSSKLNEVVQAGILGFEGFTFMSDPNKSDSPGLRKSCANDEFDDEENRRQNAEIGKRIDRVKLRALAGKMIAVRAKIQDSDPEF